MIPEIIHRGEGVHLHDVGIRSLIHESGFEHRHPAVHQQHQAEVVLRKRHVEDIVGPDLRLLDGMIFLRFQQSLGAEPVQERSVRRPLQNTVETALDAVVEHDFRVGVGIPAVVILHQTVPVHADAFAPAVSEILQETEVARQRGEDPAAHDAEIAFDGIADVRGKHDVDFPGFDGLVSRSLIAVADELDFQIVFQVQFLDDLPDRINAGANRVAVLVQRGKRKVIVEETDPQHVVLGEPVLFLKRQVAAQDRFGKVPFLKSVEIGKVVVHHFFRCGIDVFDQIGSFLVRDQIIRGRTDFFDCRKIVVHQHADFQV